jgi:hypothetical protein
MSRYNAGRYGYDYSLTPARPSGVRGALANITIFATVMAVSAISGVLVTLDLFGSSTPAAVAAHATAAVPAAPQAAAHPDAMQRVAQVFALITTPVTAPKAAFTSAPATANTGSIANNNRAAPPATVAAAPAVQTPPAPPSVAAQAPQPAPVADSDLTFAKGYAQRQAVAHGALIRHGKVVMEARTQLGRAAIKAKPRVYARNVNTYAQADQRRTATAQRPDAYGMFQRFERPDQFDFAHHQALAFGEQRTSRRNETQRPPPPAYGNSPNGMFGGLF